MNRNDICGAKVILFFEKEKRFVFLLGLSAKNIAFERLNLPAGAKDNAFPQTHRVLCLTNDFDIYFSGGETFF